MNSSIKNIYIITFAFLFLGNAAALNAAYFSRTAASGGGIAADTLEGSLDFWATEHIHQRRYLPKGEPFRTPHRWQQLYFGLSSGLYGLTDKEWKQTNVPVALSLGYEFNRHSGLRLSGTYVQIPRKHTRADLQSFGVDLDYMFNLTNYLYGYNPRRVFNFGLVPGIGFIYARRHNEHSATLKAQLGLHLGFFLGQTTELYAEPWFGLTDDKVNLSTNNPAAYDVLYGLRVGAAVRLRPHNRSNIPDSTNHKPFFEFSQGLIVPLDLAKHSTHTLGTGYQVSIGEWINPAFGLRLGFAGSQFYWDAIPTKEVVVDGIQVHSSYDRWQSGAYLAGRLEALFNPLNFGRHREGQRTVDLNIALGAELGWLIKYGVPKAADGLKKYYYGLTAAPQVLYRFDPRNSIFVEPRLTLINYSVPYSNSDGSKAYSDKIITVHAGVRIQPLARWERPAKPGDFHPRLWISAAAGAMRHIHPNKLLGDGHFNASLQVGAAYEFGRMAGLRLRAEYLRYGFNQRQGYYVHDFGDPIKYTAMFRNTYNFLSAKLGYLLNMNTLLQGYQERRRMNIFLEAGPMYSWNLHRNYQFNEGELPAGEDISVIDNFSHINNSFGIFGSVLADVRVNDNWSVQAQTEMSVHTRTNFFNRGFAAAMGNWSIQLSLGAAYQIPLNK